jgi:hypothetical protein
VTSLPSVELSPEATRLMSRVLPIIGAVLEEFSKVPVSVLLWGPSPDSSNPLRAVRLRLRERLRQAGHAAYLSEELCDSQSANSVRIQELAQAMAFDVVVAIPATPGVIAEVHDFALDRRVAPKLLVFLNQQYEDGYHIQSLLAVASVLSFKVEFYPNENETAIIEEVTTNQVQRIQELKFLTQGRI